MVSACGHVVRRIGLAAVVEGHFECVRPGQQLFHSVGCAKVLPADLMEAHCAATLSSATTESFKATVVETVWNNTSCMSPAGTLRKRILYYGRCYRSYSKVSGAGQQFQCRVGIAEILPADLMEANGAAALIAPSLSSKATVVVTVLNSTSSAGSAGTGYADFVSRPLLNVISNV